MACPLNKQRGSFPCLLLFLVDNTVWSAFLKPVWLQFARADGQTDLWTPNQNGRLVKYSIGIVLWCRAPGLRGEGGWTY